MHDTSRDDQHIAPWWMRQSAQERTESEAVQQMAREFAGRACQFWGWGDGEGGWILREIALAFAERGYFGPDSNYRPPPRNLTVLERDRWECVYCGAWLGYGHRFIEHPQIDHRTPKARGGTNELANLAASCGPCNASKGAKTEAEYRATIVDDA